MTREEALKEFIGYQTYDIQPSVEAVKVAVETLRIFTDNATNGDVIRALFSSSEVREIIDDLVHYTLDGYIGNYTTKEWWNAPYKTESEDKDD